MKVALIICPAWFREYPHLALALLSACLRSKGHEVFAFDFNNEFYHRSAEKYKSKWRRQEDFFWSDPGFISEFISGDDALLTHAAQRIVASGARVVGFSVYSPTRLISLELAKRIKEADPCSIIVFGGSQCYRHHSGSSLIREEAVDIVVTGEGEEAIVELAEKLERDGTVDFCEGAFLKKEGTVIDCGVRAPNTHLDQIPFPDFSDFTPSLYESPSTLPVLFSRGCCNNCVYCTVNMSWERYRSMSAERMFKEIKWQLEKKKEVNTFDFYDCLLNGNVDELTAFCDLVIAATDTNAIPPIRWSGESIIRPEMTAGLLQKMKRAGCFRLSYGMESGSQRVLDKMKKHVKINDAERVIRDTHEAGIQVSLNFMVGFPTETEEDFQSTLGFLKANHRYLHAVIPSEGLCYIMKGSYLYGHPEEFGLPSDPHLDYWEVADTKNTFPERLRRFEIFCELASSLNIPHLGVGYEKARLMKQENLEKYYAYTKSREVSR